MAVSETAHELEVVRIAGDVRSRASDDFLEHVRNGIREDDRFCGVPSHFGCPPAVRELPEGVETAFDDEAARPRELLRRFGDVSQEVVRLRDLILRLYRDVTVNLEEHN